MSTDELSPDAEYQLLLARSRTTAFWALDDAGDPWTIEPGGEPPPPAPDWFFVVNFPRTGSTAAAAILDLHPDVCCANEHHVLPLLMTILHTRLLMVPELWTSVRYTKQLPATAATVRTLIDAWRSCVSPKPIFGDKGEMYHQHFGPACAEVLPGCRFVLTVRHPLDTLSSYIQQPWTVYLRMNGAGDPFFEQLQRRAREMLAGNAAWRERAEVVSFEDMADEGQMRATFTRVLEHIGADPQRLDWDAAWALCRHSGAVDRWRRDAEIVAFMTWLSERDPELHELLQAGARYLPATAEALR